MSDHRRSPRRSLRCATLRSSLTGKFVERRWADTCHFGALSFRRSTWELRLSRPPHMVGALTIPAPRRVFGKYEILRRIAVGGMGEIFLAHQPDADWDRLTVLKGLLPELAKDTP